MTVADHQGLIHRIARELGADVIDFSIDERRALAEDALGARGGSRVTVVPLAVARPPDAATAARLLKLAAEAGIALVPYGAGTGLMGGARTVQAAVVLDTVRLNTIEPRPADRMVWAGAGAVLSEVDDALRPHDLTIGHDPWTYPVATVGGTISTNGLGYKGGRYGGMGDQVLALEVALADGSLIRTRPVGRRSTGPDIARLFVGAEGTLGLVTAAALRAYPLPEVRQFLSFSFRDFQAGFAAVTEVCALGMRPCFLDYGEEHASPWPELRWRQEEPPVLYLGFEGFREEVDANVRRASQVALAAGGQALGSGEPERLWQSRHVVAERFRRDSRRLSRQRPPASREMAVDYLHVSLPPSQVLEFRSLCHEETEAAGVGLFECGLWTGPELFSAVVGLPQANGGADALTPVVDRLLSAAQDLGGSMEYCHGAGVRLAHLMEREHGDAMALLRRLKGTLDPSGVLNPGKLGL